MEFLEINSIQSSGESECDSSISMFPTKPQSSKLGMKGVKSVNLYSNFYKFDWKTADTLYEYKVSTEPKLTCHTQEEKRLLIEVLKKAKERLSSLFVNYVQFEGFIYSFERVDKLEELEPLEVSIENEFPSTYLLMFKNSNSLSLGDPKVARFFRSYINQFIKKMKFQMTRGGKHFDPYDFFELKGVNMYQCYFNSIKCVNNAVYLNLNPWIKFFQQGTVLDEMEALRYDKEAVIEAIEGKAIMTIYNNRVYTIDKVEFDKSPEDKFTWNVHHKEREISYADYVEEQYKIKNVDMNQPLLMHINKITHQQIYFIPQFCVKTGISEQQKAQNFRDIKVDLFANANTKMTQADSFFTKMMKDAEFYTEYTQRWNVELDDQPLQIKSYECEQGTIYSKSGSQAYNLSKMSRDFSKELNGPYKAKEINSWAIICGDKDSKNLKNFVGKFKDTLSKDFKYESPNQGPTIITVTGNKFQDWKDAISEAIQYETFDFIVCIVFSKSKNNWFNYEPLKYFLQTECHIPSQIITTNSLHNKNVRSICKNLMIQIWAKIGDSPWGFIDLPLSKHPLMVIGISTCQGVSKKRNYVLSYVASMDSEVSSFYNNSRSSKDKAELFDIDVMIRESIQLYKERNEGYSPKRIIVYRDSVSEGQTENAFKNEAPKFTKVLKEMEEMNEVDSEIELLYVLTNKKINQRFFTKNNGLAKNPKRGFVIHDKVTRSDRFEFYLISHDGPTGLQCPTRYEVIHNSFKELDPKDLYDLANILCSGYYNYSGTVKVPNVLMYASEMCNYLSCICKHQPAVPDVPEYFKDKLFYI